jgi:predicted nucleic acid-binding protein
VGVIFDASLLVAAERRVIRFEPLLETLADEPVGIAAISAAELLHGCQRAREAGTRARRWAFVEAVLEVLPVLPFGLIEARRYAELWSELLRAATLIGPHNLMIGATALAGGHAVATLNRHEFERVPGLRLVTVGPFVS